MLQSVVVPTQQAAIDAFQVGKSTLSGNGPDSLGKIVRDYLARVGQGREQFEGVTGRIAFDATGDARGKSVVIGVVHDGALVTQAER